MDDLDVKSPELKMKQISMLNSEKIFQQEFPLKMLLILKAILMSNMPEIFETKDEKSLHPKLFSDDNQIEDEKNLNEPRGSHRSTF